MGISKKLIKIKFMEQGPKINPEKEIKKIDLDKRLEEIFKMKIDTQQEINRLEEELEKTDRTLSALEAEENEVKQKLDELELAG